jgi:hypothetical protein
VQNVRHGTLTFDESEASLVKKVGYQTKPKPHRLPPMLRKRYPVDKLFEEITAHFPKMDPILAKIDGYLEDEQLYQLVKDDLSKRRLKLWKWEGIRRQLK